MYSRVSSRLKLKSQQHQCPPPTPRPTHFSTRPIHVAHQTAAQTTLENPASILESTSRAHDQSQVLKSKYHRSKNNPLNDHESLLSIASFFHVYCYTIYICLLTVLLVKTKKHTINDTKIALKLVKLTVIS